MERTKWVDRKFNLGLPPGWLSNVLIRLEGVAVRLRNLTKELSDTQSRAQLNGQWSIKEHIGHLIDLEALHSGRIQDFINRKSVLRAADMSNKKTYAASHNERSIDQLIDRFDHNRTQFITSLKSLDDETQEFLALHPRLKVPMRVVDMAFFTAEHDDHHIASIVQILRSLQ